MDECIAREMAAGELLTAQCDLMAAAMEAKGSRLLYRLKADKIQRRLKKNLRRIKNGLEKVSFP